MANISHLGDLKPSEPIDLSAYTGERASGTSTFKVPPPGRYTVRAPESFPDTAFTQSKAGALLSQIDPKIVGGDHDGFEIRFVKVSSKVWERTRKVAGVETTEKASQLANYLKACGLQEQVPADPQAQANLVERTAGQLYEVETDWKVWDKFSQTEYLLSEAPDMFLRDTDGNVMPFITVKDPEGNDTRLRANVMISRFIAA